MVAVSSFLLKVHNSFLKNAFFDFEIVYFQGVIDTSLQL